MDPRDADDALLVPALADEVRVLGETLLDGDLEEARFRAGLLAAWGGMLGLTAVERAARAMCQALHPAEGPPGAGVGTAFAALMGAVEGLMPP